jgi:hypothetical protein
MFKVHIINTLPGRITRDCVKVVEWCYVEPLRDACMDIYKDFTAEEIAKYPRSVRFAWEVGRQHATADSASAAQVPD